MSDLECTKCTSQFGSPVSFVGSRMKKEAVRKALELKAVSEDRPREPDHGAYEE